MAKSTRTKNASKTKTSVRTTGRRSPAKTKTSVIDATNVNDLLNVPQAHLTGGSVPATKYTED